MGKGIGGIGLVLLPIVGVIIWLFDRKAARYANQTNLTIKVTYVPNGLPIVSTA